MESFGFVHWLIILIIAAVMLYPLSRILRRVGFSPWWALIGLVPFINWIALWIFAFAPWPKVDSAGTTPGV